MLAKRKYGKAVIGDTQGGGEGKRVGSLLLSNMAYKIP